MLCSVTLNRVWTGSGFSTPESSVLNDRSKRSVERNFC